VAHLNIEHYCKLLMQEMDETKRQRFCGLLAEEEAEFVSLTNSPQGKASLWHAFNCLAARAQELEKIKISIFQRLLNA
jgi:hypothetical protein